MNLSWVTTLEDCSIYDQGKKSLPFSLAASLCFCGIRTSGGNLQEALEGGTMHWHASLTASLPFFLERNEALVQVSRIKGCTAWGWEQGIALRPLAWPWIYYSSAQGWVTLYLHVLICKTVIPMFILNIILVVFCWGSVQLFGRHWALMWSFVCMFFASLLTSRLLCVCARRGLGQRSGTESRCLH